MSCTTNRRLYTVSGSNNESAVRASYEVSLLIAEKGKPHTIGEELIKLAAQLMAAAVFGEKAKVFEFSSIIK